MREIRRYMLVQATDLRNIYGGDELFVNYGLAHDFPKWSKISFLFWLVSLHLAWIK